MGLQDRDWYWKDRERRERENALVEDAPKVRPAARGRQEPAPFGATRQPFQWRQLGLLAVVLGALVWASFYAARASTKPRAEFGANESKRRQDDRQKVLAEQSAENMRQRLTVMTVEQDAEQARAAAARAELKAIAKTRAADAESLRAKWDQFYKPDPRCSASWTVECANAYIRAKRRFAEQAR